MTDQLLIDLKAGLRASGLDFTRDPVQVRAEFGAMLEGIPLRDDVLTEQLLLNTVPALKIGTPDVRSNVALLYLHGGAYVVGSAHGYRALTAELGRAVGATAYSIDYRLAPGHVFPAAIDDAVLAYQGLLALGISHENIVVAGDSAGGGLVMAMLVALRDAAIALPAAALVISPWADLSCTAATIAGKADADPSLTPDGLRAMAHHYLAGQSAGHPLASPIHADLTGLPPLLIQVGSSEILLDDAVHLAAAAGRADVDVQLNIWADMPHVWHAFAFMLPAGQAAIEEAASFLRAKVRTHP